MAKYAADAYRVLHDAKPRSEYDAILERQESPVKDPAISAEEFGSWLEAGTVSQGIAAKSRAEQGVKPSILAVFLSEKMASWYIVGYWISWVIIFIGCYIYAIASYGFLLGVGLGWLPSAIVATVVGIFWPLIAVGIIVLIFYLANH